MTAWDFSPEQREIIGDMIEAAIHRALGVTDGGIAAVPDRHDREPGATPTPFGRFGDCGTLDVLQGRDAD